MKASAERRRLMATRSVPLGLTVETKLRVYSRTHNFCVGRLHVAVLVLVRLRLGKCAVSPAQPTTSAMVEKRGSRGPSICGRKRLARAHIRSPREGDPF